MPIIRPSSDLRNKYNEISNMLEFCTLEETGLIYYKSII